MVFTMSGWAYKLLHPSCQNKIETFLISRDQIPIFRVVQNLSPTRTLWYGIHIVLLIHRK